MRKLFVVSLLLCMVAFFTIEAFAEAPSARNQRETNMAVAVAHPANGRCLMIDSEGRAYVRDVGGHTIASQWGTGLVYTGDCVVHRVIVQSQDADAYAAVYDATSATGTAKADPQSSVAKQVNQVDLEGSLFSTGIYISAGDTAAAGANTLVTVVYDPL